MKYSSPKFVAFKLNKSLDKPYSIRVIKTIPKFVVFNLKFVGFSLKFVAFSLKFVVFSLKFVVFTFLSYCFNIRNSTLNYLNYLNYLNNPSFYGEKIC